MVSPMSIVMPTVIVTVAVIPNPPCAAEGKLTARGVAAGASTSLGVIAGIMGVNVGIEPSRLYADSAMAVQSDRQVGKNFIVDLFGELSQTVSRHRQGGKQSRRRQRRNS